METGDWKSRKTLLPLLLSLAVLTAACARLNPGLSSEYRAKASQAFAKLQRIEQLLELKRQAPTPASPEIGRAVQEAGDALLDASNGRRTAGDYRVYRRLVSYQAALWNEVLHMDDGDPKKMAELATATTAARKEVEASLR